MHDATKVLLGSTQSSFKNVDMQSGEIAAGLACTLDDNGELSLTVADGTLIGISLGNDLSGGIGKTPVIRRGTAVPLQVDHTPTVGTQVQIHATTGKGTASGTAVNAVYASGVLTGVKEDGTTVNVCLVDFPGGL